MAWTLTDDPEEFLARAEEFLRGDPVRNTVTLTVAESLRAQGTGLYGNVLFGWWTDGGRVAGTVMRTGAYPAPLSTMPECADRVELAFGLPGAVVT